MRSSAFVLALAAAAWMWAALPPIRGQEAPPPDVEARLAELERRVARLERLTGVEPLSVAQAQARLAAAERQLRYTERQHRKGYVGNMELQADRLAVLAARKELELARDAPGDPRTLLELEALEAEYQLALATELLERDRRLADKGVVTPAQLRADELAVERARDQLQRARTKLEAQGSPDGGR